MREENILVVAIVIISFIVVLMCALFSTLAQRQSYNNEKIYAIAKHFDIEFVQQPKLKAVKKDMEKSNER